MPLCNHPEHTAIILIKKERSTGSGKHTQMNGWTKREAEPIRKNVPVAVKHDIR